MYMEGTVIITTNDNNSQNNLENLHDIQYDIPGLKTALYLGNEKKVAEHGAGTAG
jgi:hypothetical protein